MKELDKIRGSLGKRERSQLRKEIAQERGERVKRGDGSGKRGMSENREEIY